MRDRARVKHRKSEGSLTIALFVTALDGTLRVLTIDGVSP